MSPKITSMSELARLKEALEWYADKANHDAGFSHDGCATNVNEDGGERARAALASYHKIIPTIMTEPTTSDPHQDRAQMVEESER